MVKEAIAVYRKEVFQLLADAEDTEDPTTRSGRRAVFQGQWKKICRISLLPPLSHPCTNY